MQNHCHHNNHNSHHFRTKQQATLIRESILKDHKQNCDIQTVQSVSVHEAMRSLLDEIALSKEFDKGPDEVHHLLKQKLSLEARTDLH